MVLAGKRAASRARAGRVSHAEAVGLLWQLPCTSSVAVLISGEQGTGLVQPCGQEQHRCFPSEFCGLAGG